MLLLGERTEIVLLDQPFDQSTSPAILDIKRCSVSGEDTGVSVQDSIVAIGIFTAIVEGTLCMNLGLEQTRDRRDPRTALMYYAQATRFGWSGRALAHYEMARLLQANVEAALESAGAALREEASLTAPQKAELYRLLMELHRRTGDFDQARTFRDAYRSITSG